MNPDRRREGKPLRYSYWIVTSSPDYRDITHIGWIDPSDPCDGLDRLLDTARAVHARAARCAAETVRVASCRRG